MSAVDLTVQLGRLGSLDRIASGKAKRLAGWLDRHLAGGKETLQILVGGVEPAPRIWESGLDADARGQVGVLRPRPGRVPGVSRPHGRFQILDKAPAIFVRLRWQVR